MIDLIYLVFIYSIRISNNCLVVFLHMCVYVFGFATTQTCDLHSFFYYSVCLLA